MDNVRFSAYRFSAHDEAGPQGREFVITAEPDLEPLANIYRVRIQEGEIPTLTHTLCDTVDDMIGLMRTALEQAPGSIYTPTLVVHPADNTLALSIRANLGHRQRQFVINLQQVGIPLEDRLDRMERLIGTRTNDCFSGAAGHHHANLRLFHDGLAMVKFQGGAEHDGASLVNEYRHGQHYIEFRVIKCHNNYCMIGVQESLAVLNTYPGHGANASGKAIYGNSHCYESGTNADYGLGGFGPGDYVGVLLDMNARQVTFYVNGRAGQAKTLTGPAYYIIANVHTVGDAVKLRPAYCWHR
eukprot:TRINITY_DN1136_c2_g2_i1.p1 TRINITY_DN1136_c2_g2~~TRINITY_DN1136_c2_g2_i1.p1  ORF type:complete len:327 (-),score=28.37 TRINITY_DN1136_c2_g2_i1:260-1156(-)